MAVSRVAVVKGERSVGTVERALDLLGIEEKIPKPAMIKVNFITDKTWETGATTDPVVVDALIKFYKPRARGVVVAESDATTTNADRAAEKTGILEVCDENGVVFVNLSKVRDRVKVRVGNPEAISSFTLPKIVLESYVVNAAKLKTHTQTGVSLGLKNMFGLLPEKMKFKYHLRNIEKVIVDLNSVVRAGLTLIDGFVAMEGPGPVNGRPVKMDLVIAGKDPVATDSLAARVMGFSPDSIYHIRRAAEKGIGSMGEVEVLGESVESVARRFERR
ncbi:MAG: DUF362 domain-containing protein [Candidatus Brockarchaeota archaeon]|nr:DUF362 domain-containing protein [Candidatus Brockarchaeota archaeon]